MAWTTPRTWTTGELVTAALMNTHVRDNLSDLHQDGTWTPTLTFGGSSTGITYSTQSGGYLKVGRFVLCSARISLSSKGSATGNAVITGLPFTLNAGYFGATQVVYYVNMTAGWGPFAGFSDPATTGITLTNLSTGTIGIANDVGFTNTSDLIFSTIYMAVS